MVAERQYYQITVRRTSDTSALWKTLHVTLFAGVAVLGFAACHAYGRAFSTFNFNCVLNAKLTFVNVTDANATDTATLAARGLPAIEYARTRWSAPAACNFVQFMPLVQMLAAVVWATYFISMSRGGTGLLGDPFVHPWRIVAPLLVFCVLMLVPVLVARHHAAAGLTAFCNQFVKGPLPAAKDCEIDVYTSQFHGGRTRPFHARLSVALICEKLTLYLWVAQLVLALARVLSFADFQINKIHMRTTGRESLMHVHQPYESEIY